MVKDTGKIFFLERGREAIYELSSSSSTSGLPDTKTLVAFADGLNHGLAIFDGYIYASSDTTVYRWPLYEFDGEGNIVLPLSYPLQDPQVVVTNMNADGNGGAPMGHQTRTIAFDETTGEMYISVGSNGNVDPDSYRSRIRRAGDVRDPSVNAAFPLDFQTMEVFADGLRNEVGLSFDRHGILWGVENGADNLRREDLGGDIHEDNPAEELNRFDPRQPSGLHYGYPYCWTEYQLPEPPGGDRGTVWVWPSFHTMYGGTLVDADCQSEELYVPATLAMPGHSAPLGITFFEWVDPEDRPDSCDCIPSFPKSMDGYAFIAYHGSWNRDVPTGYKVVYVEMDQDGNAPEGAEPIDLLAHQAPDAKWEDGFRPVDVAFDVCGRLLVTSDGTRGAGAKVIRIDYGVDGEANGTTASPCSGGFGVQAQSFEHTTAAMFLCLVWMILAM